jgi:threonine/homoserine/homoserine lactone efflux protein
MGGGLMGDGLMGEGLYVATALAAFIYAVTPGPAFLAVFALAARHGRGLGGHFLLGHMAGDLLWGGLAIAAIVGVSALGPALFEALGVLCGFYLIWLGGKAMFSRAEGGAAPVGSQRPLRAGLVFGLTNPKAYPVAVAVFTAITMRYADQIGWHTLPGLIVASLGGLFAGYIAILFCAGLVPVRRFFLTHGLWVNRVVGFTFVLFGGKSIIDAARSFTGRS